VSVVQERVVDAVSLCLVFAKVKLLLTIASALDAAIDDRYADDNDDKDEPGDGEDDDDLHAEGEGVGDEVSTVKLVNK